MRRPLTKPNALVTMGQNRAAEHRADQMADLTQVCRDSALRVIELTEQVAALTARVEQLEGQR